MLRKAKLVAAILVIIAVLTPVLASYGDTYNGQLVDKDIQHLRINIYPEPNTLDFQACSSSNEMQIYNWIMEGLTRSTENGKAKPGIAEKWDISSDGKTWTFHLRDAKWTDGKQVTAYDFKYGWMRALDPENEMDYAYLLYDIENAWEYSQGEAKADQVGINVIDDKTLKVKLNQPIPYFTSLVYNPVFAPARQDIYEKYAAAYNSEARFFVTNGPFNLDQWYHDISMVFVKNPGYWDAASIKLEKVTGYMIDTEEDELYWYKKWQLDQMIAVSDDLKAEIPAEEIRSYGDGSIWYFDFNCTDPVMKNKNIRKALTLAINRESLINTTLQKPHKPALSFVCPEIIPDADGKAFREKKPAYFKDNDVATAKKMLAQGLKELGISSLPKLKLLVNERGSGMAHAQAFQQMWKENLGIDIEIEAVPSAERIERQQKHEYQISFAGWGPDYPDAMTYLDIFVTGAGNNDPAYSNLQYDTLIKAAKTETDINKRSELLHSAEQLLMDDMPIGPVYFRYRNYAVKPHVKGLTRNPFGPDTDLIYSHIEP